MELLPCLEKCLLRDIISQMRIATGQASDESAHRGLIAPHQFAIGMLVLAGKHAGDKIALRGRHALLWRLAGLG